MLDFLQMEMPSEDCFRRHIEYSGLTKIRTRRRSRRQYKQYETDSLGASAP
ncbi:glycosyl transferase family 1 [Neisseria meningitidis]|nr:glycosyl transferase family 1 [Neisseria meningitidis]